MLRSTIDDEYMDEQKQTKEKNEKLFKKRLQDKEALWQEKFSEIEAEISMLTEAHREELKLEREKIETRLREQLKVQIKNEVSRDYVDEISKL